MFRSFHRIFRCHSEYSLSIAMVFSDCGLLFLNFLNCSHLYRLPIKEPPETAPERCRRVRLACIWGFPKIRGTCLGVPIIRIIVYWGLYWGPFILGNYHILGRVPAVLLLQG